jgi:hypothetical protein
MLNFPCVATDCSVKVNDFGVRKGKGSEKLKDILGIALQFVGTMGEGTDDSSGGGIPGNRPVAVGLDGLGRFATTDGKVEIPNGGGDLVVGEGGEESGEDNVKVDRCPREDMFPFRFWERGE